MPRRRSSHYDQYRSGYEHDPLLARNSMGSDFSDSEADEMDCLDSIRSYTTARLMLVIAAVLVVGTVLCLGLYAGMRFLYGIGPGAQLEKASEIDSTSTAGQRNLKGSASFLEKRSQHTSDAETFDNVKFEKLKESLTQVLKDSQNLSLMDTLGEYLIKTKPKVSLKTQGIFEDLIGKLKNVRESAQSETYGANVDAGNLLSFAYYPSNVEIYPSNQMLDAKRFLKSYQVQKLILILNQLKVQMATNFSRRARGQLEDFERRLKEKQDDDQNLKNNLTSLPHCQTINDKKGENLIVVDRRPSRIGMQQRAFTLLEELKPKDANATKSTQKGTATKTDPNKTWSEKAERHGKEIQSLVTDVEDMQNKINEILLKDVNKGEQDNGPVTRKNDAVNDYGNVESDKVTKKVFGEKQDQINNFNVLPLHRSRTDEKKADKVGNPDTSRSSSPCRTSSTGSGPSTSRTNDNIEGETDSDSNHDEGLEVNERGRDNFKTSKHGSETANLQPGSGRLADGGLQLGNLADGDNTNLRSAIFKIFGQPESEAGSEDTDLAIEMTVKLKSDGNWAWGGRQLATGANFQDDRKYLKIADFRVWLNEYEPGDGPNAAPVDDSKDIGVNKRELDLLDQILKSETNPNRLDNGPGVPVDDSNYESFKFNQRMLDIFDQIVNANRRSKAREQVARSLTIAEFTTFFNEASDEFKEVVHDYLSQRKLPTPEADENTNCRAALPVRNYVLEIPLNKRVLNTPCPAAPGTVTVSAKLKEYSYKEIRVENEYDFKCDIGVANGAGNTKNSKKQLTFEFKEIRLYYTPKYFDMSRTLMEIHDKSMSWPLNVRINLSKSTEPGLGSESLVEATPSSDEVAKYVEVIPKTRLSKLRVQSSNKL